MFNNITDIIPDIDTSRNSYTMQFGVKYLDKATGGIRKSDLVVIGGRSGAGKSELANMIAEYNARGQNKVYVFSLEAEKNEFINRILFRNYAKKLYEVKGIITSYRDFIFDNIADYKILNEIKQELLVSLQTLNVYERKDEFTVKDFTLWFSYIAEQADLVIVDHIHHFDLEGENEFIEMKKTIKTIRDMVLLHQKPVILIAHFRKADRKTIQIIPDMEEFHGSSEISKEATQVITLAPYEEAVKYVNIYPTLFKVCKLRIDGSVNRYVGKHYFNSQTKSYDKSFSLNKLANGGKDIEEVSKEMYPFWAKDLVVNKQTGEVTYA